MFNIKFILISYFLFFTINSIFFSIKYRYMQLIHLINFDSLHNNLACRSLRKNDIMVFEKY